jgi:hypothetical protein
MSVTGLQTAGVPSGLDVMVEVPVNAVPRSKVIVTDAVEDVVFGSVSTSP